MSFTPIRVLAANLTAEARDRFQRRALLLAGERDWTRQAAAEALEGAGPGETLWLPPPDATGPGRSDARGLLGRELDILVVDAYGGFDPDALGAGAGTVRGGGLLLLLTPPLDSWPAFADPQHRRIASAPHRPEAIPGRYLRRLAALLRASRDIRVVEQDRPPPAEVPLPPPTVTARALAAADGTCLTPDQAAAVEALERVATGHRHRPLVLVSDRGRGKSSALGIAAARLVRRGRTRIVLTAPRLEAIAPALERAAGLLPEARRGTGHLSLGTSLIEFVAPDALALAPRDADLVLVDEAAAIPAPILERLLRRHARIAFATTVHGYEGTGRGFTLRFHRTLDRLAPGWRRLEMKTPIRWTHDDPVERLVFRSLLLDAEPATDEVLADAAPARCEAVRLDRDALAIDEGTLSELFGLLVLAHHRTTPLDLRHLLDGPEIEVYGLLHRGHVAATALVAAEGGLDPELAGEIHMGRRRLQGHLLPQTLSQHLGLRDAPGLRCRRVVRIAVHPSVQGRGLGRRLLDAVADAATSAGADYLGASFGASPELLRFWEHCGYRPVRVGISRSARSGSHSVAVMRPLSDAGKGLARRARERLQAHLPAMLGGSLRDLEPALAAALMRQDTPAAPPLGEDDWQDLLSLAFGLRRYEACPGPVQRLVLAAMANPRTADRLDAADAAVLIARVAQGRSWAETAALLGLPGRRAATEALRGALRTLLRDLAPAAVQTEIRAIEHQQESRRSR